jgi:hypothetical protein
MLTYGAALLVLIFALNAAPVPSVNELVYLPAAFQRWHAEYLVHDWTFAMPRTEHFLFNVLVGLVMRVVPPEIVWWGGRVVVWVLLTLLLLRLGRRVGLSTPAAALAVAIWLVANQSMVAWSWMVGTFEAQGVSYVFLLYAIDRFLEDRDIAGAICLGLCFTFHPAVGLVAGPAAAAGLLALGRPWRKVASVAGVALLVASPALTALLATSGAAMTSSREDWSFLVRVHRFRSHLEPLAWLRRDILLVILTTLFTAIHFWQNRASRALRFLGAFQLVAAVVFALGLVARALGWYEVLRITPFRVFAVFNPLLFLFALAHAYKNRDELQRRPALAVLALVCLLSFPDPIAQLWDRTRSTLGAWSGSDDLQRAFIWMSYNTPPDAVAILPPWRRDAFYLTQRAQVANYEVPRMDRIPEWRVRLETLIGPLGDTPLPDAQLAELLEERYNRLTPPRVNDVARRYGAGFLVSGAAYPYPVAFQAGRYRVYRIAGEPAPPRS